MKILLDSNAFVNLRQDRATRSTLSSLKKRGFVQIIGSCTFLEELAGIARGNPILYSEMLNEYLEITNRKILNYANLLVQTEGQKCAECSYDSCFLSAPDTDALLSMLNTPDKAVDAFDQIYSIKNSFKLDMDQTSQEVLSKLKNHYATNTEIIEGYRLWFGNMKENANDFFKDIFNPTDPQSYDCFPHVASFIEFSLTRIYERFALGIPVQPSDLHDRAHFIDATVADYLITDDSNFFNTCARIIHKRCDLLRFKDLVKTLNYWQAA